jgi:hypothetical protein
MSTEPESSQTPTPTPLSESSQTSTPLPEEIKGGWSFNPFGTTNTEDIKLKTQTDAGLLATEIQALKTEIQTKQADLKAKEYRLTQLNPKKGFFGGKKSKKTHKKSHKKSSRKTR